MDLGYTRTARILHWAVAGMVVLQFVLAKLAENAEHSDSALRQLALLANHKSVGITILVLVTVRLLWRSKNSPPALPESMPNWQVTASHVSHWSLYGLLILMPITGWLMSSASAYSVSWFNLFQLPDFVAPDPELKETFEEVHVFLAKVLFAVATVHILAAIKHAVIDKDGILSRMSSVVSIGLFAAIVALGAWTLGSAGSSSDDSSVVNSAITKDAQSNDDTIAATSNLPLWQIEFENSAIRFTGDQAGAEFDGLWQTWTADLYFSSDSLDESSFNVTIQTADVETEDDDRDSALMDPEWFDVANFPEAYYRANGFSANDDGSFTADGTLEVKGQSAPLALTFKVETDGSKRVLTGVTNLKRLDFGIGTGEWEDTTWVNNEVVVNVQVEATVN